MKITTNLKTYIKQAGIVEFQVLKSLDLTSENSLKAILSKLIKKEEIYHPLKGFYVSKSADPFFVATKLIPGYISLTTALYLHHLIEEYPFTIYIASEKRKSLQLGSYELHYFKAKNYKGITTDKYVLATPEKALYDSLHNLDKVSFPVLMKSLHRAKISSKLFLSLCEKDSSSFFQRLGYLLCLLPKRDNEKTKIIKFCKKRIQSNIYLYGRKHGTYVKEWKLIDNIGKEVLLSWWE